MAQIKCPECGKEIESYIKKCSNCGYVFSEKDFEKSENLTEISSDNMLRTKKMRKIAISIIMLIIIFSGIYLGTGTMRSYISANNLLEEKEYKLAIDAFKNLEDYKDSEKKIIECKYLMALQDIDNKEYKEAESILSNLEYKDSDEKYTFCQYEIAKELLDKEDYEGARLYLKPLAENSYENCIELYDYCLYELGLKYIDAKEYDKALNVLENLDYKDSVELVAKLKNNEMSLDKFIERYNNMVTYLNKTEGLSLAELSSKDVVDNKITFNSSNRSLTFNKDIDEDCSFNINSVDFYIKGWIFADNNALTGMWLCTYAGFTPYDDPNQIYQIVNEVTSSSYEIDELFSRGSTTINGKYYYITKEKAELRFGCSIENS